MLEDKILSSTESILIHELVHAADIICEKYLYLNKEDIDTKAQIFRYLVERSEKLLRPLELHEGFSKNTDILSIFLLGIPLKIEIISKIDGSNSVYYRKNKWAYCQTSTKEEGIVLKSISTRGCLAEVLGIFVFDMFSRKHIDDTETRAYSIGGLWESLIQDK